MKNVIIAILIGSASLGGCATNQQVQLTPMEIQALQTRQFETSKEVAFRSVVSVFQDLGYTLSEADLETGIVVASSTSETRTDWVFTGATYTSQTRATATVEQLNSDTTNVRLNFVTGTNQSTIYGQNAQRDTAILDPAPYQQAFERIENAIFIRS